MITRIIATLYKPIKTPSNGAMTEPNPKIKIARRLSLIALNFTKLTTKKASKK